jgi:hypothetical protein
MTFSFFTEWKEAYDLRHEPEAVRRLGELSWRVIVGGSLCGLGLVIGYGVWLFVMPPQVVTSSATTGVAVQSFSRDELTKIIERLEARAALFREKVK